MSVTTRGYSGDDATREPAWRGSRVAIGASTSPTLMTSLAIALIMFGTHSWQRLHGLPIGQPGRTAILAMLPA